MIKTIHCTSAQACRESTVCRWLGVGLVVALASSMSSAPAAAQQPVVLAFGDSITHGLGDGSVDCDGSPGGYPPRLRSSLQDQGTAIAIRTFGVCGELSETGASRIDDVLADNPDGDIILIMEGTNDISVPRLGPETAQFNVNVMMDKAEAAGVIPVVASVIPRSPDAGNNAKTAMFAEFMAADTQARNIIFADPFHSMIDILDLYNRFYSDPFHPNSSGYNILARVFVDPTQAAVDALVPEPCVAGDETLCLSSGRFEVEVEWAVDGDSGRGQAIESSADTGFFWFFGPDNFELVVKVLDGREVNGHFWVFYGGLSDVEYKITVRDSEIRRQKTYSNPQGTQASVGDTFAFTDVEARDQGQSLNPSGTP